MRTSEAKKFAQQYGLTYNSDFWEIERGRRVVGAALTYPGAKKVAAKLNIIFECDQWLSTGEGGIWACHYMARCEDLLLETTGYADASTDRSQTVKTFPARMAEKRAKVTLVMDIMTRREDLDFDLVDEETFEVNQQDNGWNKVPLSTDNPLSDSQSDASQPKPDPKIEDQPATVDTTSRILALNQLREQKGIKPEQLVALAEEHFSTREIRKMLPTQLDGLTEILEKFEAKIVEVKDS